MKRNSFFIIILLVAILSACQKESKDNKYCRLSSLSTIVYGDTLEVRWDYDINGKLVKEQNYQNGVKSYEAVFQYNPSNIIVNEFTGEGLQTNSINYNLADNGYADLKHSAYTEYYQDSTHYYYNSDGYLIKKEQKHYNKFINQLVLSYMLTNTYTIVNGNREKETTHYIDYSNQNLSYDAEIINEFYSTQTNYSGVNVEYAFIGKLNNSLLKKRTYIRGTDVFIEEYNYQFDAAGKPIKADVTTHADSGDGTYALSMDYQCK